MFVGSPAYGCEPGIGIPYIVAGPPSNGPSRRRAGSATCQYLKLEPRLTFEQVPYHPKFPSSRSQHTVKLAKFVKHVLIEAAEVDFDEDFDTKRSWQDEKNIKMPKLNGTDDEAVIQVTKRMATHKGNQWLVQRSFQNEFDVSFRELDNVLRANHVRDEMKYTPEIYDANEILAWSSKALGRATRTFNNELEVTDVAMQIFQMFHDMPRANLGLGRTHDRVYHILVLSAKVRYDMGSHLSGGKSLIVRLPIDIGSFSHVTSMMTKSHIREDRYHFATDDQTEGPQPNTVQRNKTGVKVVEGFYISMERVSGPENKVWGFSLWDKMIRAEEGNPSRFHLIATRSHLTKFMGAEEVYRVFRCIGEMRKAELEFEFAKAGARDDPSALDGTVGCEENDALGKGVQPGQQKAIDMNVEARPSRRWGKEKKKSLTLMQEIETREKANKEEIQQGREQQQSKSSKTKGFARKAWKSIKGKFTKPGRHRLMVSPRSSPDTMAVDEQNRLISSYTDSHKAPALLSANTSRAPRPLKTVAEDPFADPPTNEEVTDQSRLIDIEEEEVVGE